MSPADGVCVSVTLFSTMMSAVAQVCEIVGLPASVVKVALAILDPAGVRPSMMSSLATPEVALAQAKTRHFKTPVGIFSGILNCITAEASAPNDATTPTPSIVLLAVVVPAPDV